MKTIPFNFRLKVIVVGLLSMSVFGCNTRNFKEDLSMDAVDVTESFEVIPEENFSEVQHEKSKRASPRDLKIIKSAEAKYKVENVKLATTRIKQIAYTYQSYVSDLRFNNNLYQIENRFTLKVPQQYFDEVMDSIAGVASFIEYENITTKDVTEEYVDLQARLQTKLEVKGRYEEVLRKQAKTVEDILLTEDKLRILQEEIESAQGRLKYLTNKVAYSTIQIDLYETVEYVPEPTSYNKSFLDKSKNGLSSGWKMVEMIILFFINIWPLLIVLGAVLFILRKKLKSRSE